MISEPTRLLAAALLSLLITTPALAQGQFEVTSESGIATAPGLRIFTVRAAARAECSTLFVLSTPPFEPPPPTPENDTAALTAQRLRAAADRRDRSLAELAALQQRAA